MDEVNITIIGAGVIGLAIASELSKKYDNIIVLEKHERYGQETSSRNSEVLHSGIYYPCDSLKAKLCVEGIEHLYEICRENSIPHKKLGKLIIAVNESEVEGLEELLEKGRDNNVKDLELLERNAAKKIEPNTNAVAALYSPNTGIIDSHSLMKYFLNTSEDNGVLTVYNSEVNLISKENNGYMVGIKQDDYRFMSKLIINCAGLSSDHIASLAGIDIKSSGYRLSFCKGSYFAYEKPSPVRMLIYPVPHRELVGLGVHATLDLGNRLRFGPDAEYVDQIDYNVDSGKKDLFYEGALKMIPGLDREAFVPDMAGMRPKLQASGEKTKDFVITEESGNGLPGLVNLIGIESPGLTASPAIAKMVSRIVSEIIN